MDNRLQVIMVLASLLFLSYIIIMVRNKKVEIKYILTWLLAGFSFIILALFPGVLKFISYLLNIKEPVNTLFLSIIFFMLLIIFSLTLALSRNANRVKTLIQELGILKLEMDKLNKQIKDEKI